MLPKSRKVDMMIRHLKDAPRRIAVDEGFIFPWEYDFTILEKRLPKRGESYNLWKQWRHTPEALICLMKNPNYGRWKSAIERDTAYTVVDLNQDLWENRKQNKYHL